MLARDSKCRTHNPNIKIACLLTYLLGNIWLVVIWTKRHMDVHQFTFHSSSCVNGVYCIGLAWRYWCRRVTSVRQPIVHICHICQLLYPGHKPVPGQSLIYGNIIRKQSTTGISPWWYVITWSLISLPNCLLLVKTRVLLTITSVYSTVDFQVGLLSLA